MASNFGKYCHLALRLFLGSSTFMDKYNKDELEMWQCTECGEIKMGDARVWEGSKCYDCYVKDYIQIQEERAEEKVL